MYKRTNIEIDEVKLKRAAKLAGLSTAKETVDFALDRLTRTTRVLKDLFNLQGRIRFDKKYNYKSFR